MAACGRNWLVVNRRSEVSVYPNKRVEIVRILTTAIALHIHLTSHNAGYPWVMVFNEDLTMYMEFQSML
jgi:hypothetical protein